MKKLNLLLMMAASFTMFFATSCGKNETPPAAPEITLAVSGGTDVELKGTDITKDVTVTASAKADKDIVVNLSSNAAEGEASFEATSVTIKTGETSAVGKIKFMAAKFPKGTPAKKITVTIATSTENVKVDVPSTDFSVKGENGQDLPKLTITANGTEFNTTEEAKTISLTFTLSAALTEELPITLTLGSETSDNIKAMFPQIPQIKIAAGETTFTLPFDMPKGTEGKIVVNFAIDNKEVTLETNTLSATFKVEKPTITPLCEFSDINNDWWQLAGFTVGDKTISIPADAPAHQNMLAETIANVKDGDPIKIGAMSKDGQQSFYCHVWVDWNKDNQVTADEMVGTTTTRKKVNEGTPDNEFLTFNFAAPENTPSGTYHMRIGTNYKDGKSGCTNTGADESRTAYDLTINYTAGNTPPVGEDPTFSVVTSQTGDVIVPTTGDKELTFQVKLSAAAEEEQTITLAATSTGKNGTITPTSVVFAVGETSKDVKIKFLSSDFTSDAVSATVTVTATSQNLEATTGKGSVEFKVKGTAATSQKQDLQYYLVSESGYSVIFQNSDVTKVIKLYVRTDAATQNGDVHLTATVGGTGVTASDYSITDNGAIVSTAASKFKRFEVTLNKSAIGKNIVVSIASTETTIQDGSGSIEFPVTLATAPANPFDYKVDYSIDGSKTIEVTSGGYLMLDISTLDEETPETTLLLTPVITGGLELYGLTGKIVEMTDGKKGMWISVSNFSQLANGVSGKLTFTSEYTTFATGAGITFTIKK